MAQIVTIRIKVSLIVPEAPTAGWTDSSILDSVYSTYNTLSLS